MMLKTLEIENFTILAAHTCLRFSPGLNVVIGENASGKSHLLKLAYTLAAIAHEAASVKPDEEKFAQMVGRKLLRVFRPQKIGNLVHRGEKSASIRVGFADARCDYSFSFNTRSRTDVTITRMPEAFPADPPLFLPTREILSIWPGFSTLYQRHDLGFDATYYDLAHRLESPAIDAIDRKLATIAARLERLVGGTLHLKSGRFVLEQQDGVSMEIDLVAEGIRKIATLDYLIRNGSIRRGTTLFWDEPENDLNPRLIRPIAEVLLMSIDACVQIFIATHSLFLLRELEILTMRRSYAHIPQRYITFNPRKTGIEVMQGDRIEEVEPIAALDESLAQSDRYLELE